MRDRLRSHPGPVSVVGGVITALVAFFVGGSGVRDLANVALAALFGLTFGAAMYMTARGMQPPPH